MKHLHVIIALTVLSNSFAISVTAQSVQERVGYDELVALVGSGLEDGTGVTSAQVEANSGEAYSASPNNSQLSSTVFFDATGRNVGSTGHATSVGTRMYGSLSMASGLGQAVNPINSYEANDFLFGQTNFRFSIQANGELRLTGSDPDSFNFDVANHSYIAANVTVTDDPANNDAAVTDILRRLDYMANENESTMCVGVNNGAANPVPEFLGYMYNAISVGISSGNHSSGTTVNIYGVGRTKPDIVAPENFTSFSTPLVSASAAILHEAAEGTDATRTETIRALLLSGATKDEFAAWDRTTTRPLDEVFGAGELNIHNSYVSLKGGEFNGSTVAPANSVGLNGWDYESQIVAGNDLFYKFEVAQGTKLDQLSIVLSWNMEILDQSNRRSVFNPAENLGDLNLDFYDSTGSFLGSLIDESKSTVDNVEHIYLQDLPAGTYHLKVSTDTNRDFGLAWRSTSSNILLGDMNLDGVVDFFDISPFIALLTADGYQCEADFDSNEVVDFFDISPFIATLSR